VCAPPAEIEDRDVSLVAPTAATVVAGDVVLLPHAVSAPVRRASRRMQKRLKDVFPIVAYRSGVVLKVVCLKRK
jgi:hypothetical protein